MAEEKRLDDALKRFDAAMETFAGALAGGREANASRRRLEADLDSVKQDRSDLARRLYEAEAEIDKLRSANQDASARVDGVMDNIRVLLGKA